jgi:hypothetical protein
VDVIAVHGFPLDWNHWQLDEWPDRLAEIQAHGIELGGQLQTRRATMVRSADGGLEPFEVTPTFCFTPDQEGIRPHHASPPRDHTRFEDARAATNTEGLDMGLWQSVRVLGR